MLKVQYSHLIWILDIPCSVLDILIVACAKPSATNSGKGGIRTLDPLAQITVFETAPFGRSGTFP